MPTYEYSCRACGHEFEQFHSITASAVRKCPSCGKLKVERKIGIGAGILFKGGGFYETDYRSESYKKAEENEMNIAKPKTDDKAKTDGKTTTDDKPTGKTGADIKGGKKSERSSEATGSKASDKLDATPVEKTSDAASKATHPSRVGRGLGNLTSGGSLGAPTSKSSPVSGFGTNFKFGAKADNKSTQKQFGKGGSKQTGGPSGVPRRTAG